MVKFNLKLIAMSLGLIAVLNTEKMSAQNPENLYKNYHKWGLIVQYNIFDAANITPTNNPNVNYELYKNKLFALGIAYNFYQYKNWNLKAELQLQWYGHHDGLTILEPENIADFNYLDETTISHDKMGYLPLTAQYVFLNKKKFSLSIGGGLGLTYYWHYDVSGSSGLAINDTVVFEAFEREDYPLFYFSNHLQTSVYFKSKSFMIQTSLIYKKSYSSFETGTYEFKNLKSSPDINGEFNQSGDFLGISLTFYPKKK